MRMSGTGQSTAIPDTPVVSLNVENLGRENFRVIVYGTGAHRDSFEIPAGQRVTIHRDDCKPFDPVELISKIRIRKLMKANPVPAFEVATGKHRDVPTGVAVLS